LAAKPELASARLATGSFGLRTPLHVVTDWPGYYPNGPEVVRLLIAAGAEPECHDRRSAVGDPAALGGEHRRRRGRRGLIDGEAELENIRFRDVRLTVCDVSFM
jgi:hypothetical protein